MIERTLLIVKPDAVAAGATGEILARVERAGFAVRALRMARLTRAQAEAFYEIHRGKPFYPGLVEFMSSGPCVPMILEREGAVLALRDFIGATDPAKAAPGSIRRDFGTDVGRNAVHASDSLENAAIETRFFFGTIDSL